MGRGPASSRRRGMTLVEVVIALGVLAIATGCLIEVLAAVSIGRERLWKQQEAFNAARQKAEEILLFSGDSTALRAAYHDPPAVVVLDGDGDEVFDSGWAKVIVRQTVPSVAGEAEGEVQLVFGKAE